MDFRDIQIKKKKIKKNMKTKRTQESLLGWFIFQVLSN